MADKIIANAEKPDPSDSLKSLYGDLEKDKNNASYWFPKIFKINRLNNPDGLYVPCACIIKVPIDIMEMFFMESKTMTPIEMMEKVYNWVKTCLYPQAKMELGDGFWFIKNGTFSNKFSFSNCRCISNDLMSMTSKIIDINYQSLCFDAGGNTEMVVRRYIDPPRDSLSIYDGMPLRLEARVFYDFDNKKPLYAVNYWDWDHCHAAISRDTKDGIIYEHEYPRLDARFRAEYDNIMTIAEEQLRDAEELSGIWSVDLMERSKGSGYYLIDMATARTSAYWDPKKAGI